MSSGRLLKKFSNKAAGETKPEAYPSWYVEDFDEPRTTLEDFSAACYARPPSKPVSRHFSSNAIRRASCATVACSTRPPVRLMSSAFSFR